MVGCSKLRCLSFAGITLAQTALRSLHGSLPPLGRHAPDLPTRPQDRSRRLVQPQRPALSLGVPTGAILFASLLGLFRSDPHGGCRAAPLKGSNPNSAGAVTPRLRR